jgi:hypothetical protein
MLAKRLSPITHAPSARKYAMWPMKRRMMRTPYPTSVSMHARYTRELRLERCPSIGAQTMCTFSADNSCQ